MALRGRGLGGRAFFLFGRHAAQAAAADVRLRARERVGHVDAYRQRRPGGGRVAVQRERRARADVRRHPVPLFGLRLRRFRRPHACPGSAGARPPRRHGRRRGAGRGGVAAGGAGRHGAGAGGHAGLRRGADRPVRVLGPALHAPPGEGRLCLRARHVHHERLGQRRRVHAAGLGAAGGGLRPACHRRRAVRPRLPFFGGRLAREGRRRPRGAFLGGPCTCRGRLG